MKRPPYCSAKRVYIYICSIGQVPGKAEDVITPCISYAFVKARFQLSQKISLKPAWGKVASDLGVRRWSSLDYQFSSPFTTG